MSSRPGEGTLPITSLSPNIKPHLPLPPPTLQVLACYQEYEHLYTTNREGTLSKFQSTGPHPSEFEAEMERYEHIEQQIQELPAYQYLNAAITLHVGMFLQPALM